MQHGADNGQAANKLANKLPSQCTPTLQQWRRLGSNPLTDTAQTWQLMVTQIDCHRSTGNWPLAVKRRRKESAEEEAHYVDIEICEQIYMYIYI